MSREISHQPRPGGPGDWAVCQTCNGTGWVRSVIAAKSSFNKKTKDALAGTRCKACKGVGWLANGSSM